MPSHMLHLVRHGAVEPARPPRFLGRTDKPLSATGLDEARALAPLLAQLTPQAVLTSPMRRTQQTAELAWDGDPPEIDRDLREIDFGRWEGKTFDDIAAEDPDLVDQWSQQDDEFAFPGGERLADFRRRVAGVARRLNEQDADSSLVFSHGGVIRALVCHYCGLPSDHYLLFHVATASLTTLEVFDGQGILRRLSQVPPARLQE